jgi:diaminohydroxyphosphoribosylaminopyrimidine deaminase / 5-amino-6-(5-phosphoribosylamino)uracil reductase
MPDFEGNSLSADARLMARALELARRGEGFVEPNPMVGCVLAQEGEIVAEGWHQRFGGDHAEIEALRAAGDRAAGCTMYVTLEPCCHHGKTPPCAEAVIAAGVRRVIIAQRDPFPLVDGGGVSRLGEAGVEVRVGLLEDQARKLNAPYLKLVSTGRPWIIAKWAMSLDGKIASRTGDSRWISGETSRAVVHQIRGRMDAIVVGAKTARRDDPLLTARPRGARVATRVVVDSSASLSPNSQLVRTAASAPVLVAASAAAPEARIRALQTAGCEVLAVEGDSQVERLEQLLAELGRRRMTNVLVEGGALLLGSLWDAGAIDEVHVFLAPKILGGASAPSPLAGVGRELISQAGTLEDVTHRLCGHDVYLRGRVAGKDACPGPPDPNRKQ